MKDGISGQAINLLSNDVSRLDLMIFFINNVWNAPIGSFIAGIMIYLQIGYSGLIGLLILVLTMPIYSEKINAISLNLPVQTHPLFSSLARQFIIETHHQIGHSN